MTPSKIRYPWPALTRLLLLFSCPRSWVPNTMLVRTAPFRKLTANFAHNFPTSTGVLVSMSELLGTCYATEKA